ncbi:MAG: primosomal protein N' [Lachnospiraceae bacterium]|nr:primosomal protein N' [Lachnospiraceae bacterium]
MAEFANIIIDISHEKLDKTFQYRVPKRLQTELDVGMQVEIPFGNGERKTTGYVVELTDTPEYDVEKIKEIYDLVEGSIPIESQLIALAGWMRKNYGGTMNHALKTVLPVKQKTKEKKQRLIQLKLSRNKAEEQLALLEKKNHKARARLLSALLEQNPIPYEAVRGKLNITASVIRAMEELGILGVEEKRTYRSPFGDLKREESRLILNDGQQQIVEQIWQEWEQQQYHTYLIHGVTGSGKTAVYIDLIERVVKSGRQAIVLIPEIALTYQTVVRFYQRFGERVSILNSKMSPGERYDQFERAKSGELDVMIGPRSALFTPFSNLGVIIIDEEHETSYKSETIPRYHARETAVERAKMAGASVVLGSATPSIDSYFKAQQGEYTLLNLEKRIEEKPLPSGEIVDLREELRQGNRSILSERLKELMADRLEKHQQIMLFINRRGMAGFVSCRACGHVLKCPHCDVALSQHNNGKMVCHYCGYEEAVPQICPECGSKYISGFKAGTQKVEEIVKRKFPEARVLRMDFDTTRNKAGYENILSAFANQEADILIGTQMIVKGHDFPNVTLVGVLAADLSLYVSDFHGAERTFQLLTQASGRAGRGKLPGEVIIQTYSPEHYCIELARQQDYVKFYETEIAGRELMNYPPCGHMMVMLVASGDEMTAALSAELLGKKVRKAQDDGKISGLSVLGPADASVAKVKDIYKKVIYFKHADYQELVRIKDVLEQFVNGHREFAKVIIQFDFNPMNGF